MLIPFPKLFTINKKIKGIIHIGAHELEELPDYLRKKIRKIIWIEANPKKSSLIKKRLYMHKEMIFGNFAAGSKTSKQIFNIANNGVSSSLLKLGSHKKLYKDIFYTSQIEVDVVPFDDWANEIQIEKKIYNFLNIDIQGYELEALKGLPDQLSYLDYIYLEINFSELYKKCSQVKDIDRFLEKYSFKRVGTYKQNSDWGDAIYVKKLILINRMYYFFLIQFLKVNNLIFKISRKLVLELKKLNNKY